MNPQTLRRTTENLKRWADRQSYGFLDTTYSETIACSRSKANRTKRQNVSFRWSSDKTVDIVFLKGLYFEKIKDKNNMFGFSLYTDNDNFRKRRLFHKDEAVIDTWIRKLKYHC